MKVFFRRIHLYLSMAAGIVIFCSCLTGTILVFEEEIEHALHQQRYFTEPQRIRLPLSQLIFKAIKTVPKAKFSNIKVYGDDRRTVEIGLIVLEKKEGHGENQEERNQQNSETEHRKPSHEKNQDHPQKNNLLSDKKPEASGGRPNLTVFVDPYTGKIVGQFNRRKSFFFTVEMLHRFLLAGKNSIGNKIVAFSTLCFLFILITGLVLWWPKTKKIMRQRLKIKWSGGWKRLNHDLHIVTGFYTSVFLLVIVCTGLIMTFPWANKILFAIAGSKVVQEQPKQPASVYQAGLHPLSIDQIIISNDDEIINSAFYTIYAPRDSAGTFAVNMLPKGAVETTGNTVFIDQYSGKIAGQQLFADKSAGQRARAFIKPIHTGSAYGWPTKILSFAVCLLALIFPVTGLLMWLSRNKKL